MIELDSNDVFVEDLCIMLRAMDAATLRYGDKCNTVTFVGQSWYITLPIVSQSVRNNFRLFVNLFKSENKL